MNTPIRTRTRQAPAAAPVAAAPTSPNLMRTGADAEAMRVREAQRQEERKNKVWEPFRFRVNSGEVGEFIILDSDIDLCPVFYEHNITEPGGGYNVIGHEMCIKELDHCPLCERFKESYYVQMISVIDLTPYTKRDGTVIPHSKKLLAVKYQQQGFFRRLCKEQMNGNMRGAHIISHRENSKMSPAIGTPSNAIGEDQRIVCYDEATMLSAFGHPQVMSQDGTRIRKALNEDVYPYDYDKHFPGITAEVLRQKYGGVVPAGSAAESQGEWDAPATTPVPGTITPAVAPAPAAAQAPAPAPAAAPAPAPAPAAAAAPAAAPAPGGIQRHTTHAAAQAPAPDPGGVPQGEMDLDDQIPFS